MTETEDLREILKRRSDLLQKSITVLSEYATGADGGAAREMLLEISVWMPEIIVPQYVGEEHA